MKILITHTFPESREGFSTDEINFLLKNYPDWKIVSFSKYKKINSNIIYINILHGILSYFFSKKVSFKSKLGILKLVFRNLEFKESARNIYSLFLTFSLIEKVEINKIKLIYSYWLTRPTIVAYYLNYLFNLDYIAQGHGSDIYIYPPKNVNEILKRAKNVITVSNANQKFIEEKFELNYSKIKVFKLGCSSKKILKKEYGDREKKILYIGRLEAVKGIDILLGSINNLREELKQNKYTIEIYGDGTLRRYTQEYISKNFLEDLVTLKPWLSQSEIYTTLNNSKVIFLSSYSEGLPVVLMQAISVGTPIIANNVGGVREVVDVSNGILNDEISIKGFSKKIKEFISKTDEEKKYMSDNAIKKYNREYVLEKNLKEKYDYIEEVIKDVDRSFKITN